MKNFINNISKEKLQRYLFLGALILVFVAFFISLSLIKPDDNPQIEEDPPIIEEPNTEPPVKVAEKFKIPTGQGEFEIVRKFYDVDAPEADQLIAIIQFESSYTTSNGISIAAKDGKGFNVINTMSGVVTKVTSSPIYGTIVTVELADDIFAEYSSLSEAKVKVGDKVKQGDVIGVSGESSYDEEAGNHVHFKVIKGTVNYSPEKLIGKELKDLK